MSILLKNKKSGFNYEIQETMSAGISLLGLEVKSLKSKRGSLEGSHVTVRGDEAYIVNMHIPPYQPSNTPAEYDEYRLRKLLLTKKEIAKLAGLESQKGLTIVPISVYNKGRKVKVEIGIAKGKKKTDKRETIKKRDTKREIERSLKYQ